MQSSLGGVEWVRANASNDAGRGRSQHVGNQHGPRGGLLCLVGDDLRWLVLVLVVAAAAAVAAAHGACVDSTSLVVV